MTNMRGVILKSEEPKHSISATESPQQTARPTPILVGHHVNEYIQDMCIVAILFKTFLLRDSADGSRIVPLFP